ncbi:response regulator transcription factor [Lewinella sp. JB7]|uniref:response regulator transcription factor n=1 Tax=Lewinella sp. JB7 TaxID=2962887 RepID=UPI0020C9485B|nr:response regulator transcription factor [Lewinella sp. JB7]MCP9235909.1 response regulator transcription factor [Lewinella sp. JB7]
MKILIIEDEPTLAESMRVYLEAEGNRCELAADFDEAWDKTGLYDYDCILVDITLPGGSGLEIIRRLKDNNQRAGIIIVSARDSIDDRISGLELGSDDYLPKPFHLAELNARIKALVRRNQFGGQQHIDYREIHVQPQQHAVTVHQTTVHLTRSEYDLLIYFLANQNRVLTKEAVAEHLSGDQADLLDSIDFIYSHVKNLRKKLTGAGAADYIQSVYGLGYKWAPA